MTEAGRLVIAGRLVVARWHIVAWRHVVAGTLVVARLPPLACRSRETRRSPAARGGMSRLGSMSWMGGTRIIVRGLVARDRTTTDMTTFADPARGVTNGKMDGAGSLTVAAIMRRG